MLTRRSDFMEENKRCVGGEVRDVESGGNCSLLGTPCNDLLSRNPVLVVLCTFFSFMFFFCTTVGMTGFHASKRPSRPQEGKNTMDGVTSAHFAHEVQRLIPSYAVHALEKEPKHTERERLLLEQFTFAFDW